MHVCSRLLDEYLYLAFHVLMRKAELVTLLIDFVPEE